MGLGPAVTTPGACSWRGLCNPCLGWQRWACASGHQRESWGAPVLFWLEKVVGPLFCPVLPWLGPRVLFFSFLTFLILLLLVTRLFPSSFFFFFD